MPPSPVHAHLEKIRHAGHQRADCALHTAASLLAEATYFRNEADMIESRGKEDARLLIEEGRRIEERAAENARLLRERAECLAARAAAAQSDGNLQKQEADLMRGYRGANLMFQLPGFSTSAIDTPPPALPPLAPSLEKLPPIGTGSLGLPSSLLTASPKIAALVKQLRGTVRHVFEVLHESGGSMTTLEIRDAMLKRYPQEYSSGKKEKESLRKTINVALNRYKEGSKVKGSDLPKRSGLFEPLAHGRYQISDRVKKLGGAGDSKRVRKTTPAEFN